VTEQHLDLAPDEQRLESRIVYVDIGDVDFFELVRVRFNMGQRGFHIPELPLDRQREGRHRAFHALEHIDAKQVNQALFAVHLAEEALAAANLGAVLGVISRLLVWQDIAQGRITGQCEAADFQINVTDGAELAGEVNICFDVDWRKAIRETASLTDAAVFRDVPPRAGDGEVVQQSEIVESQHFNQLRWRLFGLIHRQPTVELGLGFAGGRLDTGDAVLQQGGVIAFGDKGDLIAQVCKPVVDRRGRQHEDAGLDPFLDDPTHQAVVARLLALVCRLVAEVVRLVDHHQVVVAPVHVRQIDVAGGAAVTRQIGVVQDIVVEAVRRENVAFVVSLVECPVVAQTLRRQHQYTIVAQLVVFDDRQGFEGFTEADAVCDDAATKAVQLVDGANYAITLELEQLLPHHGIADAGSGLDDSVLVHLVTVIAKQVMQYECVDGERVAVLANGLQGADQCVSAAC